MQPIIEHIIADLRYAFRTCRKNPGFSIAVALITSLAIGASATVFSIFDAVLLRPLPYRDADRIIVAWEKRAKEGSKENGVTPADYSDWLAQNHVFTSLTAHDETAVTVTGKGDTQRLVEVAASMDMLSTYGVEPLIGRGFLASDEREGGHVALLSYRCWRHRFGGARSVLGQAIDLDEKPYTIVGVLPRSFEIYFCQPPDVFVPLNLSGARAADRGSHDLLVIGRLRPGVSLSAAQAEMTAISSRLEKQWPVFNTGHSTNLVSITSQLRDSIRPTLLVLGCAVIFVLLIACANVANLLLARGFTRQRELTVRQALGAGRLRLIRMLLSESLLFSASAGVLGAGIAVGTLRLLKPILPKIAGGAWIPGMESIALDGNVLAFLIAVSIITGLLFGLVPAWRLSRNDLTYRLNDSGRSASAGRGNLRLRNTLVIVETTLSCFLLTGAMLLLTSFVRLSRVNPGFQPHQRISLELTVPPELQTPGKLDSLYTRIVADTAVLPEVRETALTNYVPGFTNGWRWGLRTETHPEVRSIQDSLKIWMRVVSPGFVSTMGIPLAAGRTFTNADTAQSAPVVLLSAMAAQKYIPGENTIGKRIALGDETIWRTVVGVVGSIKHLGLSRDPQPEIYVPFSQLRMPTGIWLVVHYGGSAGPLVQELRHRLSMINSSLAVGRIELIDDILAQSKSSERFNTVLIGSFAVLSLLLAVGGIYSVLAFLVTQQTREIGIRMALGAERLSVVVRLLRYSGQLVLIGIGIGTAGSLVTSRFIRSFLFDVSATSPMIYAGAATFLLLAGISAAVVPAWRASKVDPINALREE